MPELEDEHGFMEIISPISTHHSGSSSDDSCLSDSSFESCSSDSASNRSLDISGYTLKPLPPIPKHAHKKDLKQMILNKLPETNEDEAVLHMVNLLRERPVPALPASPADLSQNQVKLRGVLQSLVDSECNYVNSLDRLIKEYQDPIINQFGLKKIEVKVTFKNIQDILSVHKMFHIELGDKLSKWNEDETIGNIFNIFSQRMVIDFYSEYVNNYEVASDVIKECENTKQSFKDFLRKQQMASPDRLSLPGLMLKPIQRFPQFIMIIKDMLKYTPRDHHDRLPLQEALTWIENVAHQLNERKRESEQHHFGQVIINKLSPRLQFEKNVVLIRQDDMEQVSQDQTGAHNFKRRRLILMKDRLISVHVSTRDQDGIIGEKFTFKWLANLRDLELTTSAIAPNMHTKVNKDQSNTTILSPRLDETQDDPYNVASELSDMMHDISVLAQVSHLVSSLKLSYPGLTEDSMNEITTNLQRDIQGKDYQLQMLNSSTIILQDNARKKKYVFSATNTSVKQEWCIDFLLAKYALDIVNIPSWHKQEGHQQDPMSQPALLMRHISLDMQRSYTKVQCAVRVYFPTKNEGFVEHLWVCSSTESLGQVSIVSMHTTKPGLIESFQATDCEILCVETVPGFSVVQSHTAFKEDTVWMSTVHSEIFVFLLSETQPGAHRKPIHVFQPGCMIISMLCVEDQVFCGNKSGLLIVYSRNDDGEWSQSSRLTLGPGVVTSIICVGDNLWIACGSKIFIINAETNEAQGIIDHKLDHQTEEQFNYLVKTGVGVWASFVGQPNISLYHIESRRLLQDFNICSAINVFIGVYARMKESSKDYKVTSLMASLGQLWIGTDVGIILTYPLPRLRDGVPRINQRPQVALHGHNHQVKFLIPVQYGPMSGVPIRRSPSSILGKNKVVGVHKLPKVDERTKSVEMEGNNETDDVFGTYNGGENIYETIDFRTSKRGDEYARYIPEDVDIQVEREEEEKEETKLEESDEHKYFVLEPNASQKSESVVEKDTNQGKEIEQNEIEVEIRNSTRSRNAKSLAAVNRKTAIYDRGVKHDLDDKRYTVALSEPGKVLSGLSFRSELKHKLRSRITLEDLTDRDVTRDEVDRLYPTLVRTSKNENGIFGVANETNMQDAGKDVKKGSVYMRPRMNTPISVQKPDISATRFGSKKSKDKSPRFEESSPERKSSPQRQKSGIERKPSVGTSFSSGSAVDTMRKQDSNTILVLSGGDGYKDWKKRQSLQSYRPEEPCLLFWMYRF